MIHVWMESCFVFRSICSVCCHRSFLFQEELCSLMFEVTVPARDACGEGLVVVVVGQRSNGPVPLQAVAVLPGFLD